MSQMHVNYAPCFIDVPSGKTQMLSRIVMRILPETPSPRPPPSPPPPPHMSSFIVMFLDLCPGWHVSMFDSHFWKLLWMYCPGHAGVKKLLWMYWPWTCRSEGRCDRADRLAGKATITSALRFGRHGVLRSLRHYLPWTSQH